MNKNFLFSKKKFKTVYNKYLPAKWLIFVFKYFSKESEKKNLKLNNLINYGLIFLFLIGFIGAIFQLSGVIITIITLIYTGIIIIFGLILLLAFIVNNRRIKKIIKELNCTLYEYNNAINLWEIN